MEIEEITSRKRRADAYDLYKAYFDEIDAEEFKDVEIEDIILKITHENNNYYWKRKIALYDSRALLRQAQDQTSKQKAANYISPSGTIADAAAVTCYVIAIAIPSVQVGGQAFTQLSSFFDKKSRSQEERLNHSYQYMQNINSDYNQGMQSAEKEQQDSNNLADRINQNARRIQESILAS